LVNALGAKRIHFELQDNLSDVSLTVGLIVCRGRVIDLGSIAWTPKTAYTHLPLGDILFLPRSISVVVWVGIAIVLIDPPAHPIWLEVISEKIDVPSVNSITIYFLPVANGFEEELLIGDVGEGAAADAREWLDGLHYAHCTTRARVAGVQRDKVQEDEPAGVAVCHLAGDLDARNGRNDRSVEWVTGIGDNVVGGAPTVVRGGAGYALAIRAIGVEIRTTHWVD
jgi:hypothetical protein